MSHLKALLTVLGLVVLGWVGHLVWSQGKAPQGAETRSVDMMEQQGMPDFEATDIQGRKVVFTQLKDKVVILNFWASWCAPCIEEIPSLIKLIKNYPGKIHLLAISGDSNREDIDVFLKSFPELKSENIHIIWDEDRSLMKKYDVKRLPESFISSKEFKLAKKIVGTIDWFTPDAKAYMEELLK